MAAAAAAAGVFVSWSPSEQSLSSESFSTWPSLETLLHLSCEQAAAALAAFSSPRPEAGS